MISEAIPNSDGPPDPNVPFLEMGANSLVLMDVQRSIKSEFKVELSIGQFFEELTNIDALVHYLKDHTSAISPAATPDNENAKIDTKPVPDVPVNNATLEKLQIPAKNAIASLPPSEIEAIFSAQLNATSKAINELIQQQLEWLSGQSDIVQQQSSVRPVKTPQEPSISVPTQSKPTISTTKPSNRPGSAIQPQKMLSALETRARGLTPTQQSHLEKLIQDYNKKTSKSKEQTQKYRPVLADSRAAIGFRFTTKEMLYPIVSNKSRGARIWDIDGNEYIDISMGQGVSLFGHHPEFIEKELRRMVDDGVEMGPRPDNVGEVAEMICQVTGFDRVTFTNSGTEAVMAVMRLARAATKRDKIVSFEGAWHGHSDSVMGMRLEEIDGILQSKPVSPGTPLGAVADHWVLPFDDPDSLEFIRNNASSIAAVLVEPVQSRNPRIQPREFLHELRKITSETGSLLIFDEMITGFRIHLGGAQHWFGIKADMATYGKVIGGGLPIGVVAGRADLMDPIDGGMWQYGDTSYPVVNRVVFGGTFCQHPLAMTASLAALHHLVKNSPGLQNDLNSKTEYLANTLNEWFTKEQVPIQIAWFGSLFRFEFNTNLELLFYHMNLRGVFVWEWRNCFLSTAHTKQDIDRVIEVVKESVIAMRDGGFIPPKQIDASLSDNGTNGASNSESDIIKTAPLTTAQQQLVTLAEIQPEGSVAYHVNATLEIEGELDISILSKAIETVVQRHDALRSTLLDVNTIQIHPELSGYFMWMDFSTQKNPDNEYKTWHRTESEKTFDLKKGPLIHFHLARLDKSTFRLWIKAHHIVVDGLSMNMIVSELASMYSSFMKDEIPVLGPSQSFVDHTKWLNDQTFSKQEAYWKDQFTDSIPDFSIPSFKQPTALKTFKGQRISRPLNTDLVEKVRVFSSRNMSTDFMTWFAIYALWLHKLNRNTEVTVGMPVAGRSMPDSDHIIGYLTHLIPIKSTLDNQNETFKDFLKRTRSKLLRGYENQDYPFARLLQYMQSKRIINGNNLIHAVFNIDRPGNVPEFSALKVSWSSQPVFYTAFDLTLNLTEIDKKMTLECDFNDDKFTESQINQYLDALIALASNCVDQVDEPVQNISMIDRQHFNKWQSDWNATQKVLLNGPVIVPWLQQVSNKHSDLTAIEWVNDNNTNKLTYRELYKAVSTRAAWLQNKGIKKGSRVVICLHRGPELVISILAVLQCGGVFIPVDTEYPTSRISYLISDSQADLVVAQDDTFLTDSGLALGKNTVVAIHELKKSESKTKSKFSEVQISGDDLAYIIYTSGSTGEPKGAMIHHQGLSNYLHWAVDYYKTDQGDGVLLHGSIAFDATLTSLFTPLLSGKKLTLVDESQNDISGLLEYLVGTRKKDWSLLKLTTSHLDLLTSMIPDENKADITRCLVLGGEALYAHNVNPWIKHAPSTRIINEYGPTETVVGCCIYELDQTYHYEGPIPIGKPIWNTQLFVLDEHNNPIAPGLEGELFIGGDGVSQGYWNRKELTDEKFIQCPDVSKKLDQLNYTGRLYRSGDRVRLLETNDLVYSGRLDKQIKLNGYRIEPGEIESEIRKIPGVVQSYVGLYTGDQSTRLVAVIQSTHESVTSEGVRSHLSQIFPTYMIPSQIQIVDKIAITSNGKIDTKQISQVFDAKQDDSVFKNDDTVHNSEVIQTVRSIWSKHLGHSNFNLQSNFFEIGGHSMMILPMKDDLSLAFGMEVKPVDIFRYPTIGLLSTWLSDTKLGTTTLTPSNTVSTARKQRNKPNFRPISKTS